MHKIIERQLAEFRRESDAKKRRVTYHVRQVKEAEETLQQTQSITRERQVRLDTLQLDVTIREESINNHRQALNRAKTNKEYAAILTAINTEKADAAKIETEILGLMEDVQQLREEATKIEAKRTELLEAVARAEEALRDYDSQSQSERNGLRAKREACAHQLEPTTLITFNRVADHHDGEAMVPVTKLHPKRDEYICGGCNLKITLEIVNALQTHDEVQMCKVCGCILYLELPEAHRTRT